MSDVTQAKVKFEEDKSIKIVPIDKIVEFRDAKPLNVNDFDKKALYKCLWRDEKNPEEVELAVQISDLAVITNEEDLQSLQNKRGRFPKVNDTILNEFYELENDDDSIKKQTSKKSAVDEKKAFAEKKRLQKEILNEKMEKFLNSNSLLKVPLNLESAFQENSSDGILVNIEKEKLQYDSTLQERFNKLLETYNNLKKKYSSLEYENDNLRFLNQNLQMKFFNLEKCSDMQDEHTVSSDAQSKKKLLNLEVSVIPRTVEAVEYEKNENFLPTSSPILSQGQCSKEISKTDVISKTDEIQKTGLNDSIDDEMAQGYQSHCSTPTRKRLHSSSDSDAETSSRHIAKKLHFDDHDPQKHNEKIHKDIQINTKENALHKTEEKQIGNSIKKSTREKKVNEGKENKVDNSLDKSDEKKTNKSKEKHEEKRTEKSNDKNENSETGQLEFLSKSEVEEDGENVVKLYLGEGIYINQESWNDIINVSTSNRFIVSMLKEFYTPQQLSKRSLSGSETWKTPNGVHTRQKLTPKKYRIINKCTKYYLKRKFKLSHKQLEKHMSCNNKYITGHIAKVVNSMKNNKPKETKIVNNSDEDEGRQAKEKSDVSSESQ